MYSLFCICPGDTGAAERVASDTSEGGRISKRQQRQEEEKKRKRKTVHYEYIECIFE